MLALIPRKTLLSSGFLTVLVVCVASAFSCDGGHEEEEHEHGTPTGSVCPAGSTLTYESFGQDFMTRYCVRCHSSQLTGAARNDAPLGHDFDTLAGILVVAEHID